MKKFYTTLAMMAIIGSAAAATLSTGSDQKVYTLNRNLKLNKELAMMAGSQEMKKPAKASAGSMNTVCRNYRWITSDLVSESEDQDFIQGDMLITKGASGNEVLIYGLTIDPSVPLKGEVDFSNGVLIIPNNQVMLEDIQVNLGTAEKPDIQVTDIVFMNIGVDENYYFTFPDEPIKLYFDENGNLGTEGLQLFGYGVAGFTGGIFGGYGPNFFDARKRYLSWTGWHNPLEFDYNNDTYGEESSWTTAGGATFETSWFNNMPGITGIEPYKVNYQVNSENPDMIRILNPFGPETPYGKFNQALCEGSLIIDLSVPECVNVYQASLLPVLYTMNDEAIYAAVGNFSGFMNDGEVLYPGNITGSSVFYDLFPVETVMQEILKYDPEYQFSTFEDNTITITDPCFGKSLIPQVLYTGWAVSETESYNIDPVIITLDTTGIGSINGEDSNAPVKYYNIQGMEISNPEKGQLVIKKQGSKTQKYIVK